VRAEDHRLAEERSKASARSHGLGCSFIIS
jgi:hypothetical protein